MFPSYLYFKNSDRMSENPGHDELTPSESSDQPTVESYCVSPDIQNLLKVFVIQLMVSVLAKEMS